MATTPEPLAIGWQVVPDEPPGTFAWWDGEQFVAMAFWAGDHWEFVTDDWSGVDPVALGRVIPVQPDRRAAPGGNRSPSAPAVSPRPNRSPDKLVLAAVTVIAAVMLLVEVGNFLLLLHTKGRVTATTHYWPDLGDLGYGPFQFQQVTGERIAWDIGFVVITFVAPLILGLVLVKTEPRVARWVGVWLLTAGAVVVVGGLYFFAAPTNGSCRQETTGMIFNSSKPIVCPPEVQPELARRVDTAVQSQTWVPWVLIAIGVSAMASAVTMLGVSHQRLRSTSPRRADTGSGIAVTHDAQPARFPRPMR